MTSAVGVFPPPRYTGPRRPATDAERRALASTLRIRILRACLDEPLTNRQIADRLHRNPATVLHHVRTLVAVGFLIAGPPQRGTRGAREVPYAATGVTFYLDHGPEPVGGDHRSGGRDLLLATFLEEVAEVGEERLQSTRMGLRLTPDEQDEFATRLRVLLEEYAARPARPDAQRWSLYLGLHPEGS